jgi:hypothetical protein
LNNSSSSAPQITVAVPSFNQGRFLDAALESIFSQNVPVEVFVLDGGSEDCTLEVIRKWEHRLAWWRSEPDTGQAAAVNEGIRRGTAPYVCWLNSDDLFLPNGLSTLLKCIKSSKEQSAVYGRAWNITEDGRKKGPYRTASFSSRHLANRCFISQPATIIRRDAWETVGGLDETLLMAFDYDLWWKLYKAFGPLIHVNEFVAANRRHDATKTTRKRKEHYLEAMQIVRKYYGRIPLKWYISWPLRVNGWQVWQWMKDGIAGVESAGGSKI